MLLHHYKDDRRRNAAVIIIQDSLECNKIRVIYKFVLNNVFVIYLVLERVREERMVFIFFFADEQETGT